MRYLVAVFIHLFLVGGAEGGGVGWEGVGELADEWRGQHLRG